jgi:hypothetical protein
MSIQVKVIIPGGFLHDGVRYSEGDVSTEPNELGSYFIRAGWAEDTAGLVIHPKPALSDTILMIEDIIQPAATEVI